MEEIYHGFSVFSRNVYVWQITTSSMVKVIQAPIGLITGLVVSQTRSQVITHIDGSKDLQVSHRVAVSSLHLNGTHIDGSKAVE